MHGFARNLILDRLSPLFLPSFFPYSSDIVVFTLEPGALEPTLAMNPLLEGNIIFFSLFYTFKKLFLRSKSVREPTSERDRLKTELPFSKYLLLFYKLTCFSYPLTISTAKGGYEIMGAQSMY